MRNVLIAICTALIFVAGAAQAETKGAQCRAACAKDYQACGEKVKAAGKKQGGWVLADLESGGKANKMLLKCTEKKSTCDNICLRKWRGNDA
jgi:hypothetical protein